VGSVGSQHVDRSRRGIVVLGIRGERCSSRCLIADLDASVADHVHAVDRLHDNVEGSRRGYVDAGRVARR